MHHLPCYTLWFHIISRIDRETINSMDDIFPLEVWLKISTFIHAEDLFNLAITNKRYYNNFTSDTVWWPKVRKLWFLSDYNPHTLTYKKYLKKGESCFHYFRRKKNDDKFLKGLITEISVHNDNENIQKGLSRVYSNFSNYVPSLLSETLHVTEKLFRNGFVYQKDFQNLQRARNLKLDRIYIASNILESGKQLEALQFYDKLVSDELPDTDLEDVLLTLSLFDTRYHELILVRHRVLKHIMLMYKMHKFSSVTESMVFLSNLLLETIHKNASPIMQSTQIPSLYLPNLEDKSILRHYCGDSFMVGSHNYVILEKLTKLLGIEGVLFNDYGARIKEGENTKVLFNNGKATYLLREEELPPVLNTFFEKDNKYLVKKFQTYFGGTKSRFDDMNGQDQIIYKDLGGVKVVCVERMKSIQGQVIICGGFVNRENWETLENIWEKRLICRTTYNNYILQQVGHELVEESDQLEDTNIWEALGLQVGDVVWSDASQARGVIIEISDSEIGDNTTYSNRKGDVSKLKGQPLYTIFFGAYGFATFSRQFLKRDMSDRVEGLLVYDLIGKWFKTYDYKLHRFIYRHEVI